VDEASKVSDLSSITDEASETDDSYPGSPRISFYETRIRYNLSRIKRKDMSAFPALDYFMPLVVVATGLAQRISMRRLRQDTVGAARSGPKTPDPRKSGDPWVGCAAF
jgi:hypothetical protein